MSEFLSISAALDGHLNGMASVPPVAWSNTDYTPVIGTLYLRPTLLPGDTVGATISATGTDEHIGLYQVDIFAPAGAGKNAAIVMADLIADRFKPVTELTHSTVIVRSVRVSREAATTENGWYRMPVVIQYLSFTTKR